MDMKTGMVNAKFNVFFLSNKLLKLVASLIICQSLINFTNLINFNVINVINYVYECQLTIELTL